MNDQQKKYCHSFSMHGNKTKAAIDAGYSPKSAAAIGYKLYRKPEIHAEIERLKSERFEKLEISAEYVLQTILDTIEKCRTPQPMFDKFGKEIFVKKKNGELEQAQIFDSRGVLKGCELLGKHLKLFTDKIQLGGDGTLPPLLVEIVDAAPRKNTDN